MSASNPRKATAAILPLPLDCGSGVMVQPMTLGMWAALERIGSPMVTGVDARDSLDLIPSLYLLTHDPREVLRGDFYGAALEWANTVPVTIMDAVRLACAKQMNAVFDVLPELKKKTIQGMTDSLPLSPTGQHRNSDGAGLTSSGERPCRQSPSCAGSRQSRRIKSSRSRK